MYTGLLRCEICCFVSADIELSDEELRNLYRKNYFFGEEYNDYLADKKTIQRNFQLRLNILEKFVEQSRHKHLLEIGSAYGLFLDLVREKFATVQGIDITEDGVRYARDHLGLNVVQADLLEYDFKDQKFDVVCMWDTIEHLRNPHLYIQKISNYMPEGSLLALTTGDIESVNARIKKSTWRLLHPPTHLQYFSRRTLTKLLDNYNFRVIYGRYCGFYRSIGHVLYNILVLRYEYHKLYGYIKNSGLLSRNFYMNLYDIIYIIAQKTGHKRSYNGDG
jgi:SAM-dependent methyltransferase